MSRGRIELLDGRSRILVVPRRDVSPPPSETAARRLLDDALRDGGTGVAAELERLAEGLVGRAEVSRREAVAIVARALVEGRLVAVALPRPERALAAVETTDLRTLVVWEVEEPLRARVTPPDPQPVATTTWVSFEVVDERGAAADGRYRIALDSSEGEGELGRRGHRFDALSEVVRVELAVEDLRWDDAMPRPIAPQRGDDPSPADDGLFSVELVDECGEPLHGRFTLTEGNEPLAAGILAHRWRRALPQGEPVTLALTELRAHGAPR